MIARRKKQSGTILIAVLACMTVAMLILLGAVESSLRHRRQLRTELQVEQTRWLLDAGVSKAINELKADKEYQGETIRFDASVSALRNASVEIAIEPKQDSSHVKIVATIGKASGSSPFTMREREFVFEHSSTAESQNE